MQAVRDIQPFDEQLLAHLAALPATSATGNKVNYLTSNRIASYVIESVPQAFVSGGREQGNPAFAGTTRFFDDQHVPWLDADDIAFLQTYNVDTIGLSAASTRIPQLILQPERFEQVDSVAGYVIFNVRKPLKTSVLVVIKLQYDNNLVYQTVEVKTQLS